MKRIHLALTAIVVIVFMLLFPPWMIHEDSRVGRILSDMVTFEGRRIPYEGRDLVQYRFVFAPREWEEGVDQYTGEVHSSQLAVQVLVVLGLSGLGIVMLKN